MDKKMLGLSRFPVEQRFLFLTVSMVVLFVISSVLNNRLWGSVIIQILFSVILVSAILAVSESRRIMIIAVLFALVTLALGWSRLWPGGHGHGLTIAWAICQIVFLTWTASAILGHVVGGGRGTLDRINGAICVYCLIGLIWALLFYLVELARPGSFSMPETQAPAVAEGPQGPTHFSNFFYYSFITLTTLGYGDITPLTRIARSLSALEAVFGQLYIAVMIAALVGLHIARRNE